MKTVRVTIRLPDGLVDRGRAFAKRRGTTLNDVIRHLLQDYAAGKPVPWTKLPSVGRKTRREK